MGFCAFLDSAAGGELLIGRVKLKRKIWSFSFMRWWLGQTEATDQWMFLVSCWGQNLILEHIDCWRYFQQAIHFCPRKYKRWASRSGNPSIVLSGWIQVKSHSTVSNFVVCDNLRVSLTKTNSYEIFSRALFEKYEKNSNFGLILNKEFFNSSRPLFW